MQAKLKLVVRLTAKILKRQQFLADLAFVFRNNELLSKCIQKMVEKRHKEKLSEEERVYGCSSSIPNNRLDLNDSRTDLI